MAFRGLPNAKERWQRYCEMRASALLSISSLKPALSSPERFEELLQFGVIEAAGQTFSLDALSEPEWHALQEFVKHFSNEWETLFLPIRYPAYHRELAGRTSRGSIAGDPAGNFRNES